MPAISLGKTKKWLKDNGVHVDNRGSEAKLTNVGSDGRVIIYILQHKCCRGKSSTVWSPHIAAIRQRFNLPNPG